MASLFLVKTIVNLPPPRHKYLLIIAFCGMTLATTSNIYSMRIPLWIVNSASGLVFFVLGHLIRNRQSQILLAISVIIWLSISLFAPVGINMRTNDTMYGKYLMWWVYSATGIYSVNSLINFYLKG